MSDEYTRPPPLLTKPRPNVIIRYCVEPGQCDLRGTVTEYAANEQMWQTNHPRSPSEYNGTAIDDLRAWATITERIYLWDCEIVMLSRFVALSVSLTQKVSLFQTPCG